GVTRGGMNPEQAGGATATPLPGIVLDDRDGQQSEGWIPSTSVPHKVGIGYVHDNNENKGSVTITYTPEIPAAGEYELILFSTPHSNRASNVPVTILISRETAKATKVNQKATAAASLGK